MLHARRRTRTGSRARRILGALALFWCGAFLPAASPVSAGLDTEIQVPIVGVRNGHGTVFVALYEPGEWLKPHRFLQYRKVKANRGSVYAAFHGIQPGRYGIAVFHDENANGRVDTNVLGLPKEGYGFSRVTPRRKPSFEEVAFDVRPRGHAFVQLRY